MRPSEYLVQVESGLDVLACAPATVLSVASTEKINSDFIRCSVVVLSNRTKPQPQGLPKVQKESIPVILRHVDDARTAPPCAGSAPRSPDRRSRVRTSLARRSRRRIPLSNTRR